MEVLANYVQKVFACRKGCGDQQNQPGKKRLKLLLNGGAGGLLTAPAQLIPSLETKCSQSAEPCEQPQAQAGGAGRIETLISLKIYIL